MQVENFLRHFKGLKKLLRHFKIFQETFKILSSIAKTFKDTFKKFKIPYGF